MIKSISIDEFLQRVRSQPKGNIWSVLVVTSSPFNNIVEELKETLEIFIECEVKTVSAKNGALILIQEIKKTLGDYLLLFDFELWKHQDWREFDYLRSRLDQNKRGGVLILSWKSTQAMFTNSPNFASWIGARVFNLALNKELLTKEESQIRLSALHEWSGLSDTQVIELAETHKLPPDPEYGEWLILLDRGDLIER